jgi:hypothetical protein
MKSNNVMKTGRDREAKNQKPIDMDAYVTERTLTASQDLGKADKMWPNWMSIREQIS